MTRAMAPTIDLLQAPVVRKRCDGGNVLPGKALCCFRTSFIQADDCTSGERTNTESIEGSYYDNNASQSFAEPFVLFAPA